MAQQRARWTHDPRPYTLLPDEHIIDFTYVSCVEGRGNITLPALVSPHRRRTIMAAQLRTTLSELGYSVRPMSEEEIGMNTFFDHEGVVRCSQTVVMWYQPALPPLDLDFMRCPIVESDIWGRLGVSIILGSEFCDWYGIRYGATPTYVLSHPNGGQLVGPAVHGYGDMPQGPIFGPDVGLGLDQDVENADYHE